MSECKPTRYQPVAVSAESTVVAEFTPEPTGSSGYQSEAELEREFIKILQSHRRTSTSLSRAKPKLSPTSARSLNV